MIAEFLTLVYNLEYPGVFMHLDTGDSSPGARPFHDKTILQQQLHALEEIIVETQDFAKLCPPGNRLLQMQKALEFLLLEKERITLLLQESGKING